MLFWLRGPIKTVCYVHVCDLTLCVSPVEFLGRLRVTVSECEASSCGCFPARRPPSLSNVLRAQKLLDLCTRAFFSFYVFAFFALSINVISL